MHQLILASQSPRRRELLHRVGLSYRDFPVKVSEIPDKNLNQDDQVLKIAETKAREAKRLYKSLKSHDFVVLAADTVVCLGDQLLGKPQNQTEARHFLDLLSGQEHSVKTAFFLLDGQTEKFFAELVTTKVQFRRLSASEIQAYVESGEPMDKAGGYGIQGAARAFVERIEGDLDNVIGLPVTRVREVLRQEWGFA